MDIFQHSDSLTFCGARLRAGESPSEALFGAQRLRWRNHFPASTSTMVVPSARLSSQRASAWKFARWLEHFSARTQTHDGAHRLASIESHMLLLEKFAGSSPALAKKASVRSRSGRLGDERSAHRSASSDRITLHQFNELHPSLANRSPMMDSACYREAP